MPINPNILLQGQVADIGKAISQGFDVYSAVQTGKLNQQKLEKAQFEADLLKGGVAASRLKPFITSKDYTGFKTQLQREGLDQEDMDMLDTYARANRWDELGGIADQFIQTARDSGVFGKLGTTDTYETSASKNVRLLNDLENQLRNGEITEDQFYARRAIILGESIVDTGGGGSGILRKGETTVTPATVRTAGGAGAGAGAGAGGAAGGPKLTPKDLPPGANVIFDKSRSGREGQTTDEFADYLLSQGEEDWANFIRNLGKGRSPTGGAVTPDKLPIPQPSGGPATQAEMEQPVGSTSLVDLIAKNEKLRAFAKRYGEDSAKNVAELENTSDLFEVNKAGFDDAYPEVRLGEILAKAPDSRVGQIFSEGIGNFLQGVESVDADFELGQAFRAAVGLIPFPPGAQSQAEQEAREKEVGDLINAKVSKEVRIKSMSRLLNREQAKAKKRWDIANRKREEAGLPKVPNPFEKMTPRQGAGAATPAPTAIGGGQNVPNGVDPADWAVMTPEERALWQ